MPSSPESAKKIISFLLQDQFEQAAHALFVFDDEECGRTHRKKLIC